MLFSTSTHTLAQTLGLEKAVDIIMDAGFPAIDMTMFDLTNGALYKQICSVLGEYPGQNEIVVKCTVQNKPFKLGIKTSINNFLINQLNGILGSENVVAK